LGDEVVLVLSDASLGADGQVLPPATDVNAVLAGNEGNLLLVNGRVYPTLPASSGRRQRWRILNAARSRYFELGLEGHSFLQIGSDGGRIETPVNVANPVLAPGERLDLLVTPKGDAGTSVDLMSLAYSRGLPLPRSQPQPLVKNEFVNDRPSSPPLSLPPSSIAPVDTNGAERVSIALTIDSEQNGIRMGINGAAFGDAEPVHARVGSTQVLVVDNKSPYSHPFHLHGFYMASFFRRSLQMEVRSALWH
jgi:FtsP/CotA-like multicopper oxidase with cupredoxin domain